MGGIINLKILERQNSITLKKYYSIKWRWDNFRKKIVEKNKNLSLISLYWIFS